jgi:hypothetical protein
MSLAQRMAIQQRAVDEARVKLVAAARDRKMLEKLRDKRKAEFVAELARKDFAELDDAISRLSASEQAAHAADVVSISASVFEEPTADAVQDIAEDDQAEDNQAEDNQAEDDQSGAPSEAPHEHAGLGATPEEPA